MLSNLAASIGNWAVALISYSGYWGVFFSFGTGERGHSDSFRGSGTIRWFFGGWRDLLFVGGDFGHHPGQSSGWTSALLDCQKRGALDFGEIW